MMSTWNGPPAMKSIFTRMFCCKSCPNIVKTNNFINFQTYFLQKVKPDSFLNQKYHGEQLVLANPVIHVRDEISLIKMEERKLFHSKSQDVRMFEVSLKIIICS